jgi:hypothetical protein
MILRAAYLIAGMIVIGPEVLLALLVGPINLIYEALIFAFGCATLSKPRPVWAPFLLALLSAVPPYDLYLIPSSFPPYVQFSDPHYWSSVPNYQLTRLALGLFAYVGLWLAIRTVKGRSEHSPAAPENTNR